MIFRRHHSLFGIVVAVLTCYSASLSADPQHPPTHRIYSVLMDPREHPDYDRYHVQPPHWGIFRNRVHFAAMRGFETKDNKIINYREKLDQYTLTNDLGDVIWPNYSMVFAENLADVLDEIKRRNLFLFDIYGYVPGSGPGGFWRQYQPPEGVLQLIDQKLGDHWLGMDNGDYFLKEGIYTLVGAETAQGLPNSQVYYAFIRGAGKQYGVPWFGNASVFNRWGFKAYNPMGEAEGYENGPTKATSLSLLKRLLYSHILYNSMLAGFEMQHLKGDELSPVGRIQQSAKQWSEQYGPVGVMLAPVAIMTDFYAGWTVPWHLYTKNYYRVWGNLPYGPGDYLMDDVLDMFYPGYQNSSYYHDETGFISATPYGDCVDCLLSDAPGWLLDRYALLVIAGQLEGGVEMQEKLTGYVKRGGLDGDYSDNDQEYHDVTILGQP